MMKKQYDCPEFNPSLFLEDDVILASNNDGSAINSDEWDNKTSGGFDL